MVEVTEELISKVSKIFVQDYIKSKKIEKFFNNKFEDVVYSYQRDSVEVFLKDEDLDDSYFDDDGYFFKHDYLSIIVDSITEDDLNVELDGEKTSWIIDRLLEKEIDIHKKSEMIQ